MTFDVQRNGEKGVVVIRVEDQLLVGNRKELEQIVSQALASGDRKFLVDFTTTRFIDSSGLAALLGVLNDIKKADGTLRLAGLNDDLRAMFDLTKLDAVFTIDAATEGAFAAF